MGRRETKVPPRPVNGGAAARYRPERGTDTHLPAVRPAPRRLASAPIRVLRGGSILITTKFPTRPPRPPLGAPDPRSVEALSPSSAPGAAGPRHGVPVPPAAAHRCVRWGRGAALGPGELSAWSGSADSGPLARCVTRRHGGVAAPFGRCPPVTGERNETKRKKTKEKAERAGLALHTPAPRRRGPWPPASCDPALFTWARRWRGSGARSGRGGVTRGPRAAAERGGRGEPVRAGGDAPAPRYMREHWRGGGVRKTRRASGTCTSHGYCPPGRRVLGSGALAGPHVFAPSRSREGTGGARRAGVPTYLHVLSTGRRGGGGRGSLRGPRPPRPRAQPRRAGAGPAGRSPGKRPPPAQP